MCSVAFSMPSAPTGSWSLSIARRLPRLSPPS
jgi:hypothetical protein